MKRILDIFMLGNRKKSHYSVKELGIFFCIPLLILIPCCPIPYSVSLESASEIMES